MTLSSALSRTRSAASLGRSRSAIAQRRARRGAPRTVLVIPCYNEALRLDTAKIRQFVERQTGIELCFVNDGSGDGTAMMLDDLARNHPHAIQALHLPGNCGKAEAVRQGLLAALNSDQPPAFVGFLDADFATPPEAVLPFCELLNGREDLQGVLGVRLRLAGHRIKRELHRYWLGKMFSLLASAVIGVRLRDTQCGAKLFRASGELRSALHRPFLSRWVFDVELLSRLGLYFERNNLPPLDWAMYEYPLDAWSEVGGSKLRLRDYWRAIWDLGQIFWENTWYGYRSRETTWWSGGGRNNAATGETTSAEPAAPPTVGSQYDVVAEIVPPHSTYESTHRSGNSPQHESPAAISEQDEESLLEQTLAETNELDEQSGLADLLTPASAMAFGESSPPPATQQQRGDTANGNSVPRRNAEQSQQDLARQRHERRQQKKQNKHRRAA